MKRNKTVLIIAALAVLMLATSCSAVFTGSISGSVSRENNRNFTKDDGQIYVYAFFDENLRNQAVSSGKYMSPSSSQYYGSEVKIGGDGRATYNFKIVWESGSPAFGKTADKRPVYLAFYNENYGMQNGGEAMLVSDTAVSAGEHIFRNPIREKYTVRLELKNVADNSITYNSVDYGFKVMDKDDNVLFNSIDGQDSLTGGNIEFYAPSSAESTDNNALDINIQIKSRNNENRKQSDNAGTLIAESAAFTVNPGTNNPVLTLYVKNFEMPERTLTGRISLNDGSRQVEIKSITVENKSVPGETFTTDNFRHQITANGEFYLEYSIDLWKSGKVVEDSKYIGDVYEENFEVKAVLDGGSSLKPNVTGGDTRTIKISNSEMPETCDFVFKV